MESHGTANIQICELIINERFIADLLWGVAQSSAVAGSRTRMARRRRRIASGRMGGDDNDGVVWQYHLESTANPS